MLVSTLEKTLCCLVLLIFFPLQSTNYCLPYEEEEAGNADKAETYSDGVHVRALSLLIGFNILRSQCGTKGGWGHLVCQSVIVFFCENA